MGANSPEYKAYRDSLVKDLKVKDNEGNEGIAVDTVKSEITSRDAFISATYKYNTDAGMQNPVHSYVVSKNPTDLSYGGTSFVREFVDAARKMIADGSDWTECVTDYGVHLLWNDGKVAKDEIKWEDRNNYGTEGGSASWRFYQEIYTELKTLFADKQIATLYNSYKQGGKITIDADVISAYTDSIGVEYKD